MNRDMTFERLLPRVGAVPPITADLLVTAGVALFTASDAAVSVLALAARRRLRRLGRCTGTSGSC
ncbi:hypothetical protein ACFC7A_11440 [Streptomyces niveus]|uniref:hypothetical protein n=1 Tax=Streptomyces niveus TaxID=193462 RepID=UPI0034284239